MGEKEQIRRHLRVKRQNMMMKDVLEKSMIIQRKLEKNEWFQSSNTIVCYISYGHEVSTHDIIKKMLRSDKTVLAPCSDTKTCTIHPTLVTSWNDLTPRAYGILEPSLSPQKTTVSIDLIILPGIGFDYQGNRLGHGKGYFDRFLHLHPEVRVIGLAYHFQILDTIPTGPHDKPVDIIMTEQETIHCRSS